MVSSSSHLDRRLFEGKLKSSIVYPEFFPLSPEDRVVNLGCGVGPQVAIYKGEFREMTCVDLSEERLRQLSMFMQEQGITNFLPLKAPVESTGLSAASFEKALCIDIIEHLPNPEKLLLEVHRLLRFGGTALITIPVMHDRYVHIGKFFKRLLGKKNATELPSGHLDRHNSDISRRAWIALFSKSALRLKSVRATTLFPPLHLYGLPRFWFTVGWIHSLDRFFCSLPLVRRLGQTWMCILEKPYA